MKCFLAEGKLTKAPAEIKGFSLLKEMQRRFFECAAEEGWMLLTGLKANGEGRYMLVAAESSETAAAFLSRDPFRSRGLSEYSLTEM